MPEYITKERAQDFIIAAAHGNGSRLAHMLGKLEDEPPADVVEVVRCEDCKHRRTISGEGWGLDTELYYCGENEILVSPVGYCSDGKKKDGDERE